MGKVIAVVSGKGGTGKTSFTAGVASCLAAMGKKVVAIDGDNGLRNLDIALGLQDQVLFDFTDVFERRASAKEAIVGHPQIGNLKFLSAPLSADLDSGTEQRFLKLLKMLADISDYVFVDAAAGIGDNFTMSVKEADLSVVVATPDATSLRDARRAGEEIMKRSRGNALLVLNRVNPRLIDAGGSFNVDEAIDRTGLRLLGIVPEDETVIIAANRKRPLIFEPNNGAGEAYYNIARRLEGKKIPLMKVARGKWKLTM